MTIRDIMVRLSFILPCYNVERYIGACIDSLFRQDIPVDEYEVICVNDCSKDSTREIIAQYQQRFTNIRLIDHKQNMTAGGARNTGMDVAVGEYIWFVDPDDFLKDNCIAELLKRAEEGNLDIAMFERDVTNDMSGEVETIKNIYPDSDIYDGYSFLDRYFNKDVGQQSCVWLQLYRRRLLEDSILRYPLIRVSQDTIFAWKALFAAKRVQSESQSRYVYRRNCGSATSNIYTAEKVYAASVLSPYEMAIWIREGNIRTDYVPVIRKALKSDMSLLWKLYPKLDRENKEELYALICKGSCKLRVLYQYLGGKKKVALMSRVLGMKIFNNLMLQK